MASASITPPSGEPGPSRVTVKVLSKARKPVVTRTRPITMAGKKLRAEHKILALKREEEEVNRLLLLAGYSEPEKSSKCVRAGLIRRNFGFKFTGEASQLDQVVLEAKCSDLEHCDVDGTCSGTLKATVRKLLEQPDYAGVDYEDGLQDAKVECDTCKKNRSYVTFCCSSNKPSWNSGKSHNHCTECKGLGQCIGDYREAHCYHCGGHFFAGFSENFECPCLSKSSESEEFFKFLLSVLSD